MEKSLLQVSTHCISWFHLAMLQSVILTKVFKGEAACNSDLRSSDVLLSSVTSVQQVANVLLQKHVVLPCAQFARMSARHIVRSGQKKHKSTWLQNEAGKVEKVSSVEPVCRSLSFFPSSLKESASCFNLVFGLFARIIIIMDEIVPARSPPFLMFWVRRVANLCVIIQ